MHGERRAVDAQHEGMERIGQNTEALGERGSAALQHHHGKVRGQLVEHLQVRYRPW